MTLLGIAYVYLLWINGVFGEDKVMAYVAFLCFASPIATSLVIIIQILDTAIEESTAIIFRMYVFSVFSITLFSYIFIIMILE